MVARNLIALGWPGALCHLILVTLLPSAVAGEIRLTDPTGREVRLARPAQRVISLAPNMTEVLFALGLTPAAVTTSCNYPSQARSLPKVGGLDPDYESILRLKPDLVLASTAGNRADMIDYVRSLGCAVYTARAETVDGVLRSIEDVGALTGRADSARAVVGGIREKLSAARAVGPRREPRVLFLIWPDPIMTVGAGTFIHDVIADAGGRSVTDGLRGSWPVLSREEVVRLRPEVVVMSAHGGWLPAGRLPESLSELIGAAPVVVVDEDLMLRPGPRIGDAVLTLAKKLSEALH